MWTIEPETQDRLTSSPCLNDRGFLRSLLGFPASSRDARLSFRSPRSNTLSTGIDGDLPCFSVIYYSLAKGDEILVRHKAFHTINPFITPDKVVEIRYLVWILRTRKEMIYTSIFARNNLHARVKTGKVGAFKFLKQLLIERCRNIIFSSDMLHKMYSAVVTFVISFLSTRSATVIAGIGISANKYVFPISCILLCPTERAEDRLIISLCSTIKTKICCIPLFSQAVLSFGRSFCMFVCAGSTKDCGSLTTARRTAIFTQSGIYSSLLGFIICHWYFLHIHTLLSFIKCLWRNDSIYRVRCQENSPSHHRKERPCIPTSEGRGFYGRFR